MNDKIETEILRQVVACGAGKSVSPSDIARALQTENWQSLLGRIRVSARHLARAGQISILRKGKPIDPTLDIKGVIRLCLPTQATPAPAPTADTLSPFPGH